MEQLENVLVANAAGSASVGTSTAPVDTLSTVGAPLLVLAGYNASVESYSVATMPPPEATSAGVVSTVVTTCSQLLNMNTHPNENTDAALVQSSISGDIVRVEALIAAGVDVNMVDKAGLSAIAYAAACDHRNVVQALLAAKASFAGVSEGLAVLMKHLSHGKKHVDVDVEEVLLRTTPMLRAEKLDMERKNVDADEGGEEGIGDGEEEEDDDMDWDDDMSYGDEDFLWDGTEENEEDGGEEAGEEEVVEEENAGRAGGAGVGREHGKGADDMDWGNEGAEEEDEGSDDEDYTLWAADDDESEKKRVLREPLLLWAAKHRYVDVVKLLLAAGTNLRAGYVTENANRNALHIASASGQVEVLKALLDAGATAFIDEPGWAYARNGDGKDTQAYAMTPLYLAVDKGHIAVVQVLLAAGADANKRNSMGDTVLHRIPSKHSVDLVRVLLAAGPDVNIAGDYGLTPLHYASFSGIVAVTKMLLAAGADVNARDCSQRATPLYNASYLNKLDTAKCLLAAGADVNVQNKDGDTALYVAMRRGWVSMVKALVAAGADVTTTNNHGYTALHRAAKFANVGVLKALLDPDTFCANIHAISTDRTMGLVECLWW